MNLIKIMLFEEVKLLKCGEGFVLLLIHVKPIITAILDASTG